MSTLVAFGPNGGLDDFDFEVPADLYFRSGGFAKRALGYRRFDSAAEAIRFVVEDLPRTDLPQVLLEVGEERIQPQQIPQLYDSPRYPLPRAPVTRALPAAALPPSRRGSSPARAL